MNAEKDEHLGHIRWSHAQKFKTKYCCKTVRFTQRSLFFLINRSVLSSERIPFRDQSNQASGHYEHTTIVLTTRVGAVCDSGICAVS